MAVRSAIVGASAFIMQADQQRLVSGGSAFLDRTAVRTTSHKEFLGRSPAELFAVRGVAAHIQQAVFEHTASKGAAFFQRSTRIVAFAESLFGVVVTLFLAGCGGRGRFVGDPNGVELGRAKRLHGGFPPARSSRAFTALDSRHRKQTDKCQYQQRSSSRHDVPLVLLWFQIFLFTLRGTAQPSSAVLDLDTRMSAPIPVVESRPPGSQLKAKKRLLSYPKAGRPVKKNPRSGAAYRPNRGGKIKSSVTRIGAASGAETAGPYADHSAHFRGWAEPR